MNRLKDTLSAYISNLLSGYRLIVGRKPLLNEFHCSVGQILLLILTVFSLDILLSYLLIPAPATFDSYGLNYFFALTFIDILLILFIAAVVNEQKLSINEFLLVNFSISPLLIIFKHSLGLIANMEETYYWINLSGYVLFIVWNFVVIYWLLSLFFKKSTFKTGAITASYIALSFGSVYFLPDSEFWYSEKEEEYSEAYKKLYNLNVEDVFYSQFRLMIDSTDALMEHTPGTTDLYLLAFGGYGLENVFLKEVEYVQSFFDEQFNTKGKSLVLVNNVDTVEKYPMANYSNMYYGLSKISKKIDPEEDILFLFMTSHGSKSHKLSLNYGPIELNNLSPSMIKEALDSSGIKWRIIVVSSCYSGGFIDDLKNPDTLIITAAAKNKTSFGCGAQSEFTDFGTAYFKYALKQENDFIDAFQLAKNWIEKKEKSEQREPSLPQFFLGVNIEKKIRNLTIQIEKVKPSLDLGAR